MKPERHYDALTTAERLALTVEAFARLDTVEIDRLQQSMPLNTYRMSNADYWRRLQVLNLLALTHGLRRKEVVARAMSSLAIMTLLDDADLDGKASDALSALAGRLKAYDDAWKQFCGSIGLDPETTLKGFQAGDDDEMDRLFLDIVEAAEGIDSEMDEALRDQLLETYRALWGKFEFSGH